jgi:hypothetical protein
MARTTISNKKKLINLIILFSSSKITNEKDRE